MNRSLRNGALITTTLLAILIAAAWLVSFFKTIHSTTVIEGVVVGLAIKTGYLDIEFTTLPGDAADKEFAFIYLPPNAAPKISATFGTPPGWQSSKTIVNHKFDGRPDGSDYSWHSQFTSPSAFLSDRLSQTFVGRWSSGCILFIEVPFSILLLIVAYWPMLNLIYMIRTIDSAA